MKWGLLFALSACSPASGIDVGDSGAITKSYEDGGRIDAAGGCYRRSDGSKFILYFEAEASFLCAAVSFRRSDAGFSPLFGGGPWPHNYVFYDDAGVSTAYEIDDARVGVCSAPYEQSDGRLDEAATRIDDFRATLTIHAQAGRALGFDTEGSLAFVGRRYWFSTNDDGAGLSEDCVGP